MFTPIHAQVFDYLALGHKVNFDPVNKLITIPIDVTEIDVQVDLYSDSKEWMMLRQNRWVKRPIRSSGGDLKPDGNPLGRSFFLTNGWRIYLDHGIKFIGNLYTDDYASPFVLSPSVYLVQQESSAIVIEVKALPVDLGVPSAQDNANAVLNDSRTLTTTKYIALK